MGIWPQAPDPPTFTFAVRLEHPASPTEPATLDPSRTTSVITATTEVVISEKSKLELRRQGVRIHVRRASGAARELVLLAEKLAIPVATSLNGKDSIRANDQARPATPASVPPAISHSGLSRVRSAIATVSAVSR